MQVKGVKSAEKTFRAASGSFTSGELDPEMVRNVKNLATTELLPKFMVELSYKSKIICLSCQ